VISLVVVFGSGAVFAHGNGPGEPDPHCSFKLTEAIFYLNAHLNDEATQNRHFCHFYPRLGGVVFSVTDKSGAAVPVQLQLLSFTDALAEIILNQTVENRSTTSQAQLSQVFTARGLYMLRVNAQQNKGNGAEKTFIWLAVGLPIAEVFLGIAGFFLIMLIYYAIMPTKNKPED
jgi:hypothetical protein